MNKLKAWLIAGRHFAFPWIAANALLGTTLAGFNVTSWLLSLLTVYFVLVASHFINAWRDYILGFDTIEDGSNVKPYTAASQLIPRGYLTVRDAKISAAFFLCLSLLLFYKFIPHRLDTLAIYILGVFVAITYTDFFKPKGLGELALFWGHGFGTVTFSYVAVKPITLEAIVAGCILGLFAGLMYTVDQWQDIDTDFKKRVKNFAYMIFAADVKISTFYYFSIVAVVTLHIGAILLGAISNYTALALLLLPLMHFTGVVLDYNLEKGIMLALLTMLLYPVLMSIGIILWR